MAAAYAWVITRDLLSEDLAWEDETGTAGPSDAPDDLLAIVRNGGGRAFRLLDDDGEHYYSGRYVDREDGEGFGPLDDYGTPNAGCTTLQYRAANGSWVTL